MHYHHIIPISCGGTNTPRKAKFNCIGANLIGLTIKEHFFAHHLLWKICKTSCNPKIKYATATAFMYLSGLRSHFKFPYKISAKSYERLIFEGTRLSKYAWTDERRAK